MSDEPSLNHKLDVNAVIGEGVVEISSLEAEGSVTSECTDFNTVLHQRANSASDAAEMVTIASIEAKYVLEGDQVSAVGCAFFLHLPLHYSYHHSHHHHVIN